MGFLILSLWLTLQPQPVITDQGFVTWYEQCEDSDGHPLLASDGAWDCIPDDVFTPEAH